MEERAPQFLYEAPRQRKREYYQFIKLVPTPEAWERKRDSRNFVNGDADYAWCERCSKRIHYDSKNSSVGYHKRNEHSDDYRNETTGVVHSTCGVDSSQAKRQKLSQSQKEEHDLLLADWVSSSTRPISIVEDPGLKAYSQWIGNLSNTEISLPCRTKFRERIRALANDHRVELKKRVVDECDFFSVTTDLWTDRAVRSFIGLTLHYVDDKFQMHNWCLGVRHFPGKHSNQRIAATLDALLREWHLSKDMCALLLRDGASNAVKAAKKLAVQDMSCVAHCLHLVVSGALVRLPKKLGSKRTGELNAGQQPETSVSPQTTSALSQPTHGYFLTTLASDEQAQQLSSSPPLQVETPPPFSQNHAPLQSEQAGVSSDDMDVERSESDETDEQALERMREVCAQVDQFLADQNEDDRECLTEVRKIVAKFREIAVYFHKSSKATSRLHAIQLAANNSPRQLSLDCPTRWSSTWEMLVCFEKMKTTLKAFEDYLHTVAGIDEFDGKLLDFPTDSDWLTAKCMRILLDVFTVASALIGAEGYSTLVLAIPALRVIRRKLNMSGMFVDAARQARQGAYVAVVVAKMERVRRILLKLFDERFKTLNDDLAWITVLDPRNANMKILESYERPFCREQLLEAMLEMAGSGEMSEPAPVEEIETQPVASTTPQKMYTQFRAVMFGREENDSPVDAATQPVCATDLRLECEKELNRYFEATEGKKKVSLDVEALTWWQVNGEDFPLLGNVAQKWLGCVASTVPCERMFSTSGNIVSARRCKLCSGFVDDLMMIAHNRREESARRRAIQQQLFKAVKNKS